MHNYIFICIREIQYSIPFFNNIQLILVHIFQPEIIANVHQMCHF
jgi:hypothetical protein